MSRRNRQRGHLRAVPDPVPSATHRQGSKPPTKPQPTARRRGEPDPRSFDETDLFEMFDPGDDVPPPARAGIAAEMARAADDLPVDDILDQLAALGLPPDLVDQSRALGDEHRAELAGLLTAATAMMAGDPVAGLLGIWQPLLDRKITAFEAELAAAEILWTFDGAAGEDDLVDGLVRLIDEAEPTGRPEALVMCRMLAHLGPPAIHDRAVRAADTLAAGGIRDRSWVSSLGTATFQRAYGYDDGAARVFAVEFGYGRRRHAFVFIVDPLLPCLAGLYATDDVEELHHEVRQDALAHHHVLAELAAAEVGSLIRAALALPFCPEDEDDEADMEGIVPIVRERLRHLPDPDAATNS